MAYIEIRRRWHLERLGVSAIATSTSKSTRRREWVAIDLETTGLSPIDDAIIEVGAVRFDRDRTIDEFQTFVNPRRKLTPFIRRLTGITQEEVDGAPTFPNVAGDLVSFIDGATPIAHNATFDFGFLKRNGIDVGPYFCDSWELAYLLRPSAASYALEELVRSLGLGPISAHRAVHDARAVRDILSKLLPELASYDRTLFAELRRVSNQSGWNVGTLLDAAEELLDSRPQQTAAAIGGVDSRELAQRLRRPSPIRAGKSTQPVDPDLVVGALAADSQFADAIPGFEHRPQQQEMAAAVAATINEGRQLMVEAGTGVGKSLAYLLPAALYAVENDRRVVVSTATINLQEQLIKRDLPMVKAALAAIDTDAAERLRFTTLKGRANYLCYKRWNQTRRSADMDVGTARVVAKTLAWLADTQTGDRGEINLGHPAAAASWNRLSAQHALECPAQSGPCFLKAARDDAAASHIVVVNHALLLSDLAAAGNSIPDYDVLIVDEAHNLEDEATRQLGFSIGPNHVGDLLSELTGEHGLVLRSRSAVGRIDVTSDQRESVTEAAAVINALAPRLRSETAQLFNLLAGIAPPNPAAQAQYDTDSRIVAHHRDSPEWLAVSLVWQNVEVLISDLLRSTSVMADALGAVEPDSNSSIDSLVADWARVGGELQAMQNQFAETLASPQDFGIYWVSRFRQSSDVSLNGAPLHVGEMLSGMLYSEVDAIIMTSATLTAEGSLAHTAERLGFTDAEQMVLGSPFDFYNSALLYTPTDLPRPGSRDYQTMLETEVVEAATAAIGRTMALFTSYAALNETAAAIKGPLAAVGIEVIAQTRNTSNQVLAERFLDNPRSILLGTSSFWEGVDFPGDALSVLIVTKLPFQVPTDPIVQARSEQYQNAFTGYMLPQAILRFRQGFGRLIRSSTDRGVAIVLDPRIVASRYGTQFVNSLPNVRHARPGKFKTNEIVKLWLES